jgi:prepilin peptidase CpaA
MSVGLLLFALFPLAMAFAAASDLFTMTISNKLTLALLACFIVLFPFLGLDLRTLGFDLLASAIVLAIAFGCFAAGWIGGGDAKLAAVIVLWLGAGNTLEFVATSAVFGGTLTLLLLAFRRSVVLPVSLMSQEWLVRLHDSRTGVPYGIALAAAALVIYPNTAWLNLLRL